MEEQEKEKYEDIINLPYNGRSRGPRMSMYQRAAQFAPFAALKETLTPGN